MMVHGEGGVDTTDMHIYIYIPDHTIALHYITYIYDCMFVIYLHLYIHGYIIYRHIVLSSSKSQSCNT